MNSRHWGRRGTSLAALVLLVAACTTATPDEATPLPTTGASSTPGVAVPTLTPSPANTPTAAPSRAAATVTIAGISFGPPEITVPVGDLTFVNSDAVPHTVTEGQNGAAAPGARFDTLIAAGDTLVVTLDTPGDYQITCQFHAQMHLVVHAR